MRSAALISLGIFVSGCVLVQVQKKDKVLSRTEEKTETREARRVGASLSALGSEDGSDKLVFSVREKITLSERKHFHEQVSTENRLIREGGRLRFFAGWLAFAYEDEGWGSVPLTLGVNLPIITSTPLAR